MLSYMQNFGIDMYMLWSLVCFGYYNKNTIHWRHLNNRNLFLNVLEAGKFKSKALAYLVSGESSLSGSQMTLFCLCPHMAKKG